MAVQQNTHHQNGKSQDIKNFSNIETASGFNKVNGLNPESSRYTENGGSKKAAEFLSPFAEELTKADKEFAKHISPAQKRQLEEQENFLTGENEKMSYRKALLVSNWNNQLNQQNAMQQAQHNSMNPANPNGELEQEDSNASQRERAEFERRRNIILRQQQAKKAQQIQQARQNRLQKPVKKSIVGRLISGTLGAGLIGSMFL